MKVFVAGHRGLVGSATVTVLSGLGHDILTVDKSQLNLKNQEMTLSFLKRHMPDAVVMAAAKVGGIKANSDNPVSFLSDNLAIQQSLFSACADLNLSKLVFLGSSCVYPKLAHQPIKEESLLTGPLEETNKSYAIAKIAGVQMVDGYRQERGLDYLTLMPCNLYGDNDNFSDDNSHVIPALIRKIHNAKVANLDEVRLWGTGAALREFMHASDLAKAIGHVINNRLDGSIFNVGTGEEVTIRDLAMRLKALLGYSGKLIFDSQMPDGTPRKVLDSSRFRSTGWDHSIDLESGLSRTVDHYLASARYA